MRHLRTVSGVVAHRRAVSSFAVPTRASSNALACTTRPADGSTHWTSRLLAKRLKVSKDTVVRVWRDHDLQPWKVDTFKLSNDPHFEEKLIDVVGLYMNPPERAVVLCFDEKTQCQALDRTQPSLPMKRGRRNTMTHDYKLAAHSTDLSLCASLTSAERTAEASQ